jgi:hypothetical protein
LGFHLGSPSVFFEVASFDFLRGWAKIMDSLHTTAVLALLRLVRFCTNLEEPKKNSKGRDSQPPRYQDLFRRPLRRPRLIGRADRLRNAVRKIAAAVSFRRNGQATVGYAAASALLGARQHHQHGPLHNVVTEPFKDIWRD